MSMNKNRKAQSAMEYLMTYGWAIIIVIIVGLILWRLGVLSPAPTKSATSFDTFFIGTNFKITNENEAILILKNNDKQGRDISLNTVIVDGQDTCGGEFGPRNIDENWTVFCTDIRGGKIGVPYSGVTVDISYNANGIDYVESGIISGKYEIAGDVG